MPSAVEVFFKALLDDGQLETDAIKAGNKMGSKMGGTVSQSLKKTLAGAGIGTAFVGAVEAGAKFEDQLRTINTVAKLSDTQLNKVGDDILGLSRESGKTTDDLTQGFYDLVSAGVPADKAINVLRASAILATGSLGTTAESVDLVTSAMGAYGLSADQATRITDIFAQAVADGKTTVSDLAGGISQVAPIAASAGISLEEVAAQTAIMTIKGDSASQAMTRIRNAISALLTPNATLAEISKRTGINFANLAKEKGLAVALDELRKATHGNNEEFAKALGSSEALTLAFSVTGDNAGAMADELGKVKGGADKGGVALEQYAEKSKSATEVGKRLVAQIQSFIITIGGPFVSSVGPAIFAINQLGQAFGLNGIAAKALGGIIGGLATRLGPKWTFFWKTMALGGTAIFAKALDVGIAGKDVIGRVLGSAWRKVAGSSLIAATTAAAGTAAGVIYGRAVAAGEWLTGALSGLWSRVIGLPAVGGAIAAAGTAAGTIFAAASTAAILAAPAVIVTVGINWVLTNLGPMTGPNSNENILRRKAEQEAAAAAAAAQKVTQAWVDASVATGERQGQQAAGLIVEHYGDAMIAAAKSGSGKISSALTLTIKGAFGSDLAARNGYSRALGNRAAGAIAEGIRSARDQVQSAWDVMIEALKHPMSRAKDTAKLLGQLTSKELIKGLRSQDPAVRAQAQYTKQLIIDRLNELVRSGAKPGKDGMEALRRGLKSKDPDIRAAAQVIAATIKNNSTPKLATMRQLGINVGNALAGGLLASKVASAVAKLAQTVFDYFATHSPAKLGPLSLMGGPEGMGRKIAELLTRGVSSGLPAFNATLARGIQVPSLSGPTMAFAPAMVGSTALGDSYNIDVRIDGAPPAHDPLGVARQLARFAQAGAFKQRR